MSEHDHRNSTCVRTSSVAERTDSQCWLLAHFDTAFLIDDSERVANRDWLEIMRALQAIALKCAGQGTNGFDIYFLNHYNSQSISDLGGYHNVTTPAAVAGIFQTIRPSGRSTTGIRLRQILKAYLAEVESSLVEGQCHDAQIRPLNIVVIVCGRLHGNVESVVINAAQKLDSYGAMARPIRLQFFQVGQSSEVAESLEQLGDLWRNSNIRDMVDTVPGNGGKWQVLSADVLLKAMYRAVTRRLGQVPGKHETSSRHRLGL